MQKKKKRSQGDEKGKKTFEAKPIIDHSSEFNIFSSNISDDEEKGSEQDGLRYLTIGQVKQGVSIYELKELARKNKKQDDEQLVITKKKEYE